MNLLTENKSLDFLWIQINAPIQKKQNSLLKRQSWYIWIYLYGKPEVYEF